MVIIIHRYIIDLLLPGNLSTFKAKKLEEFTTYSKNNDFQPESHQNIGEEQEINSSTLHQTDQKADVLRATNSQRHKLARIYSGLSE